MKPGAPALPPGLWAVWSPLWRRRRGDRGWRFPLAILALYALAGGGGYALVVRLNAWRGTTVWSPVTALDRELPALPWTLPIYWTLYLYLPLYALTRPRDDGGRVALARMAQAQTVVGAISLAAFLALPCEVAIREQMRAVLDAGSGWRTAYELLWWIDAPWNAWPSLHVSSTWLVVRAVRARNGRRNAWLVVAWIALVASTLTTKQHFVFDAATGLLLGELGARGLLRRR